MNPKKIDFAIIFNYVIEYYRPHAAPKRRFFFIKSTSKWTPTEQIVSHLTTLWLDVSIVNTYIKLCLQSGWKSTSPSDVKTWLRYPNKFYPMSRCKCFQLINCVALCQIFWAWACSRGGSKGTSPGKQRKQRHSG